MAEIDFSEERQFSESVFEKAEIGMVLADAVTGKWLRVNNALCRLLGYSTQDLLRHAPEQLVHPIDRGSDRELAEQVTRGIVPSYTVEKRFLHRNGASIPCRFSCSRLPAAQGEPPHLLLQMQLLAPPPPTQDNKTAFFSNSADLLAIANNDGYLEEVNPAWEELREITLHLNQVTESVPALLFQWYAAADGRSGFKYFNGRSEELYGVDRETLMRDWRQVPVHPDDWPMVEASIERAIREQTDWLVECRMLPGDDEVRWVHCESTPTSITEDEIVFSGVILDITERREARAALEESEARFRSLAEGSLQGIVVESIADDHKPLFVNEAAARIYGFDSADEVMALPSMNHLAAPETLAEASSSWESLATGEINCVHSRIRALRKDSTPFWVELMGSLIQWGGKPAFQMTLVDITEQHLAQEALKANEQRLRTIADNLPILMAYIDKNYRYRFNNRTYTDWFGVAQNQLYGKTVLEITGRELHDQLLPYMKRALNGEKVSFEIEGDGGNLPAYCEFLYIPDFDIEGNVAGFYTMVIDISDRRQHAMLLERQNLQDGLTGLFNRRGLFEQLPVVISSSLQHGGSLAVLFLDLDRFKQINDTFGHVAGDQLLIDFAHRLKDSVRASDVVVRLAGDEFVLLLANLGDGRKAAEIVADKIITAMQSPFSFDDTPVVVSTSIGICVQNAEDASGTEMLKQADQAMYQAKREGRNRYSFG